eukprot:10515183-Alexandrium_andersonii.AAC.1
MSASLVGSEMCIRDRTTDCRRIRRGRRLPPIPSAGQGRIALRACWGPEPVSYTHLTLPTICSV